MCVSVLADLPGCSVATPSTYTTKLEHFDEIRTPGKSNFKNEFIEMVFQLLEEIIIFLAKLERQILRETTVGNILAKWVFENAANFPYYIIIVSLRYNSAVRGHGIKCTLGLTEKVSVSTNPTDRILNG